MNKVDKANFYKERIFSNNQIDERLLFNPQFKNVIESYCNILVQSIDGIGLGDVKVSEDGKTITMSAEGKAPNMREELSDNVAMRKVKISLEGDSMVVDNSFGFLLPVHSLRSIGVEIKSSAYTCALNTQYDHAIFDKDGIEMSRSEFLDSNCFLTGGYSVSELKSQLLSANHKPTFKFNALPESPWFCTNATASNMYRDYGNLGLAECHYSTNIKKVAQLY